MSKAGIGIALLLLLTACGSDQTADEPLNLPEKENTWVKTEEVDITKDAALAHKIEVTANIPINQSLHKKLMEARGPAPKSPIKDTASCFALLDPLDKTRMFVQREGGAWSMFERSALIRADFVPTPAPIMRPPPPGGSCFAVPERPPPSSRTRSAD